MRTTSSYWHKHTLCNARCCVPPCRPSTTCSAPSIRRNQPNAKSRSRSRKCSKGDAHLATWKHIRGRDIDTVTVTLHLPEHRIALLQENPLGSDSHKSAFPPQSGTGSWASCAPWLLLSQAPSFFLSYGRHSAGATATASDRTRRSPTRQRILVPWWMLSPAS
jgi:hypothetical protein